MFTLWYSVLSFREYRNTQSNIPCPKSNDVPAATPTKTTNIPVAKPNEPPAPVKLAPTPSPVQPPKPIPTSPPAPAPAPTKVSNPVEVPSKPSPVPPPAVAKPAPRVPNTPSTPTFERLEQMQESKTRGIPAAPTSLNQNQSQRSQQPLSRSPLPSQRVQDAARTNAAFIKRENSYSSEEEAEEDDDEEEEDDSEIERIDLHSKIFWAGMPWLIYSRRRRFAIHRRWHPQCLAKRLRQI